MSEQVKVSESIRLGTLLAFSGGFLDAYTFMTRDGTFANAETGNIVRVGIYAALGEYGKSLYYMIPVIAFAIGIFVAVWFREKMNAMEKVHWKEAILLVEILVLFMAGFMPQSMNLVDRICLRASGPDLPVAAGNGVRNNDVYGKFKKRDGAFDNGIL